MWLSVILCSTEWWHGFCSVSFQPLPLLVCTVFVKIHYYEQNTNGFLGFRHFSHANHRNSLKIAPPRLVFCPIQNISCQMHHFQRKTDNMQTPERRPLHACYGQMEVKEHILLYILCTLRLQLVRGVRDFILAKIVRDLRWLLARRKADWLSPNSLISADVSICHSTPAGFGGFHDNNDNIPNPKGRHL